MNPESFQNAGQGMAPDTSLIELAAYATIAMLVLLMIATMLAILSLPVFFGALYLMRLVLADANNMPDPIGKLSKVGGLVFRNLQRNLLRTALTYVALFVLTFILTFLYGLLASVESLMTEKEGAQMVIMTDKFNLPSQMPPGYPRKLKDVIREKLPKEHQPDDVDKNFMTWSFVVGTLDKTKLTKDNSMFLFALDPDSVQNEMLSEYELNKKDMGPENWALLERMIALAKEDKKNVILGEELMQRLGKKVGDEFKLFSLNYADLEFEYRIVGSLPAGSRLGMAGVMRLDYLQSKMDEYATKNSRPHPLADKCINLIWVRMPSKAAYQELAAIVGQPETFNNPAVKMETFSAAIGTFLEPFKDILWGLKFIVIPSIVGIMILVIGITITIGVRERWAEMAVMKVLGFQPWQIVGMIVSEAMLIGLYGGMLSTWTVYYLPKFVSWMNKEMGGSFKFFDSWKSDPMILVYGPLLGMAVGLVGAALPSWNARKVKVSEVFAQVA